MHGSTPAVGFRSSRGLTFATACTRTGTLLVALALAWVPILASAESPTVTVLASRPAPALSVTTFKGRPFNLAAQHGKWVLVYFWSSWCRPCTDGLSVIAQFLTRHKDVTTIGLDMMEQQIPGHLNRFLSSHSFDFPLATIEYAQEAKFAVTLPGISTPDVPIPAIPVTWVIAPDGTARQTWMGGFNAARLDQLMLNVGYRASP